jgi:hypothetical protein
MSSRLNDEENRENGYSKANKEHDFQEYAGWRSDISVKCLPDGSMYSKADVVDRSGPYRPQR